MKKIKLNEDVLIESTPKQTFVYNVDTNIVVSSNEVGAFIIKLIEKGPVTNEEILTQVREEFDTPRELDQDVETFLSELMEKKIIQDG